MTEKKSMTIQELLDAPLDSLTVEDMGRRSQVILLMKAERALEVVNEQNRKFTEEKEQKQKQIRTNLEQIAAQHAEDQRVKKLCRHKTGGKDRPGFFQGDGDIYGYAVSKQQLPTGEVYGLCFRCQKEWHDPDWWAELADGSVVFDGRKYVAEGKLPLAL